MLLQKKHKLILLTHINDYLHNCLDARCRATSIQRLLWLPIRPFTVLIMVVFITVFRPLDNYHFYRYVPLRHKYRVGLTVLMRCFCDVPGGFLWLWTLLLAALSCSLVFSRCWREIRSALVSPDSPCLTRYRYTLDAGSLVLSIHGYRKVRR